MKLPLVLAAALALSACATMDRVQQPGEVARTPEPAKAIDAGRFYTGVWHEIGRRPMWITDGCVAGTTAYTPGPGGALAVLDDCRQGTPEGKRKTIGGPGTILDPGTNAKLRVRYRFLGLPVTRDFWVLDRADDYSWFISADPSFTDLYIYTRAARPDPDQVARLTARAQALGYDVSKLEFPAQ
jgi:apolipoprotein D and lipocalin family protein